MMHRRLSLILLVSAGMMTGCGSDPVPSPEPYLIQVNSLDVVPAAVTQMQIILEPSRAGQMFEMVTDMPQLGGEVQTRVSGAGEFVINVDGAYVIRELTSFAGPSFMWSVEIPIRVASEVDDPAIGDPTMRVSFFRATEQVAEGTRFLEWPPRQEGRAVVTVACLAGLDAQCQNAGGAAPDAGMPDAP